MAIERLDAEFVWVLDPIDGTKSFIAGMPCWGTLIGLLRNGQPCYGMMHQPFTRERFSGDGGSARYRGPGGERTLRTRSCAGLSDAALYHHHAAADAGCERSAPSSVIETGCASPAIGGDCYAYCMLAAGLIDLVIEADLQPYDIVALVPIIEGAGGSSPHGPANPQRRAAPSWHPATGACTARCWSCSTADLFAGQLGRLIARVIRRAGDERVERGPDQRTDVVALHQEFVFRPGTTMARPAFSRAAKRSAAGVSVTRSRAGTMTSMGVTRSSG